MLNNESFTKYYAKDVLNDLSEMNPDAVISIWEQWENWEVKQGLKENL